MTKRLLDLVLSAVGLVLLSPGLLVLTVLTKLQDGGPVLFRQQRVGQYGRPFTILKFRSMTVAKAATGAGITQSGDPRITPIGRFLRRTKLDELPQLWNVLIGDMSLVGPRPELQKFVDLYSHEQRAVLELKPGVTDLASLLYRNEEEMLRNARDVEQTYIDQILPRKIELSLVYGGQADIWDDLKIIIRTLLPWAPLPTRAERANTLPRFEADPKQPRSAGSDAA